MALLERRSQREPAAGPGGGDRYLYPATQESSNVPLAGICLQIFPHWKERGGRRGAGWDDRL